MGNFSRLARSWNSGGWWRVLLCLFLLQGTLVAAEPGECSGGSVFSVGHDSAFEQEPAPAVLESESSEGLEDPFSYLVGASPRALGPCARRHAPPLADAADRNTLRRGHPSRAPPLL